MKTIHFVMVAMATTPAKNIFDEKAILNTFFKQDDAIDRTRLVEVRPEKLVFCYSDEDEFQKALPRIVKRCAEHHAFAEVVSRHMPETESVRDTQ